MNHKLINIGFSLSEPLHSKILNVSQELRRKYNSDWYLDDIKYHLHFPMYLIAIPIENETHIKEISDKYLKVCKRSEVQIQDLFFNKSGLLMIKFEITDELFELHKLSLKYYNPLRNGILREKYLDPNYLNSLKPESKSYVKEYGSEYVLNSYVPHVTIARIKDLGIQEDILSTNGDVLKGLSGNLNHLQVHTAVFSENKEDDRTIMLYDKVVM